MSNNPRFLSPEILAVGAVLNLDFEQSAHCARVLRLREGDSVSLINGQGCLAEGTIVEANPQKTMIEVKSIGTQKQSSQVQMAFGLTKPSALELIFRKCTELGVASFQPLVTDHSLHPESWNEDRWQKIVVEACKQSQELWFPKIFKPVSLSAWLKERNSERALVVCDEALRKSKADLNLSSAADVLIGPEGGWSDAERKSFEELQPFFLGLGPNRLRAETACLVALALVKSRLGEI
ncbi:MAG: 16S rRNA (uracil(1498)-N(3))-methyltransferase [Proteobacteria bacterium]|nr:16S rRNA (uracil(1498)-N(3))-methyltransferase [Pseudomonadota bacterium]